MCKAHIREETMEEEEKGFVIKDKRTFSPETGDSRTEEPQKTEEEIGKEKEAPADEEPQLPEINFSTFIFSLNSSALLHFGEIPDPSSGTNKKNLAMAKHTIDILGMLEEKTRGNLTRDEEQLFNYILYDLRMRYVNETE